MNDTAQMPKPGSYMGGAKLVPLTSLPDVSKLKAHPLADEYPVADQHEFAGLKASIKANGIRDRITLIEVNGALYILDGRNRFRAGLDCGHLWKLENFQLFQGTLNQADAFVHDANDLRRHLSKEQKEKMVEGLLKKYPEMSSRKLAMMAGVSHTTIANLRKPQAVDDSKYRALTKAWDNASVVDQEKFAQTYRVDLYDMLRS